MSDPDYALFERQTFKTSAPSCIQEAWEDENGGLWVRSNDGDQVVIPKGLRAKFAIVARMIEGRLIR